MRWRVHLSHHVSSWRKEEHCCSGHSAPPTAKGSCGEHDLSSYITKDIFWTNNPPDTDQETPPETVLPSQAEQLQH